MLEKREKAAREFLRNLAVDASAGTGKTATLVARVTNLFLDAAGAPAGRGAPADVHGQGGRAR